MIINGHEYRIIKDGELYFAEMFSTYLNEWVRMSRKGYKTKGAVKRYIIPNEYKTS